MFVQYGRDYVGGGNEYSVLGDKEARPDREVLDLVPDVGSSGERGGDRAGGNSAESSRVFASSKSAGGSGADVDGILVYGDAVAYGELVCDTSCV